MTTKEIFKDWYINTSGQNYMPFKMIWEWIEENILPHEFSKVKCHLCNHEWIAVRPKDTERLECPNCNFIMKFDVMSLLIEKEYLEASGYEYKHLQFPEGHLRYWRKDKVILSIGDNGFYIDLLNDKEQHIKIDITTIDELDVIEKLINQKEALAKTNTNDSDV